MALYAIGGQDKRGRSVVVSTVWCHVLSFDVGTVNQDLPTNQFRLVVHRVHRLCDRGADMTKEADQWLSPEFRATKRQEKLRASGGVSHSTRAVERQVSGGLHSLGLQAHHSLLVQ